MAYSRILVCVNRRFGSDSPSCAARGGEEVLSALQRIATERGLHITVEPIRCFGRCSEGANVRLAPGGPFMDHVSPGQAPWILDECLGRGE